MRRSTLIICLVAVLALSIGIFILYTLPDDGSELSQPEQPPAETIKDFFSELPENVKSIHFLLESNTQFILQRDPVNGEITLNAEDAIFPADLFMIYTMFEQAITLSRLVCVAEDASDAQLTLLGFDKPVISLRIERIDGTSIDIEIGAEQTAGQGRYIRKKDSREVFILNEIQQMFLIHELEDLYDLSFLPYTISPNNEESLFSIKHILIEAENNVIELQKRSDEEFANAVFGTPMYKMIRPVPDDSNDYMVQTIILENVARIVPDSIEAINPSDMSVYGLDRPARLTISTNEWSGTLLIGNRNAERGGRYVMIEGFNAVLFDYSDSYSFLDIDPAQLRTLLIWLYNIEDVSSITYELEGETRVLKMEHNIGEPVLQGWLDGKELSTNNTRRLYASAFNITQNGATDAVIPADPPVYTIIVDFNDGGSDMLELYRLNDSHFLIVHNGTNRGLFTTRMNVQQNLLSRFEILDAGGDIPML